MIIFIFVACCIAGWYVAKPVIKLGKIAGLIAE